MTATNHVLTGAAIALAVKQPGIAVPLSFLSHFALDALPHFGVPLVDVFERNAKRSVRIVIPVDVILTVTAFVVLTFLVHASVASWVVLACMAAAYAPDSVWAYRFVREIKTRQWRPGSWFSRFHEFIQWGEREWGIWVELAWLVMICSVIARIV